MKRNKTSYAKIDKDNIYQLPGLKLQNKISKPKNPKITQPQSQTPHN